MTDSSFSTANSPGVTVPRGQVGDVAELRLEPVVFLALQDAHTEFAHEGICYPLRTRGTIPAVAKCPYYEGFSWADPDPEHLRFLLRHVYENRDEARRKGAAAAEEMAQKWTWDHAAAKILTRLDALSV